MGALSGQTAMVAGAARGAGRGVARMLGEAGARVVCTGRSTAATPPAQGRLRGRPETVEETSSQVTAAGGEGVWERVDHADGEQVRALFERAGRVGVVVNVLGGEPVPWDKAFHEQSLESGRALVESWLWPLLNTTYWAARRMVAQGGGLIVTITEGETLEHYGGAFHDLVRIAQKRLMHSVAEELGGQGVVALAVAPGFMRTEEVLAKLEATESNWREVAVRSARARGLGLAGSETPCFVGRAVAALAADPDVRALSGGLYGSWELADRYGFTDIDGSRPHWGRYFADNFAAQFAREPATRFRWVVASG